MKIKQGKFCISAGQCAGVLTPECHFSATSASICSFHESMLWSVLHRFVVIFGCVWERAGIVGFKGFVKEEILKI